MTVVGVDPGGATTGIVIRHGFHLRAAELIYRDSNDHAGFMAYCGQVIEAVHHHVSNAGEDPLIALEDVHPPKGAIGMINVQGVIDTAKLVGMLLAEFHGVQLVDPGGHGSAPLAAYPAELVGVTEKVGTGKRRHVRSAWDIAGCV